MHLTEKLSFLKGIAEGMQDQLKTPEGRLLLEMLQLFELLIDEVKQLNSRQDELHEYVDAIDEDLLDVETFMYDDDWLNEVNGFEITNPPSEEDDHMEREDHQRKGPQPEEGTLYI